MRRSVIPGRSITALLEIYGTDSEYIAAVLNCDPKTIRLGLSELRGGGELDAGRTRKRGADASG
jgi:hypothetical protein